MTIPTPAPTPATVKVACRATKAIGVGERVVVCTRKGHHDKHINYRANVAWSN